MLQGNVIKFPGSRGPSMTMPRNSKIDISSRVPRWMDQHSAINRYYEKKHVVQAMRSDGVPVRTGDLVKLKNNTMPYVHGTVLSLGAITLDNIRTYLVRFEDGINRPVSAHNIEAVK